MTGDGLVMTMRRRTTMLVCPKFTTEFNKINQGIDDNIVRTPDTVTTVLNTTMTTASAGSKNEGSISTPKLEERKELYEASYALPANSVCNVIRPVWYGTPPPTRESPWATDVSAMSFPHNIDQSNMSL